MSQYEYQRYRQALLRLDQNKIDISENCTIMEEEMNLSYRSRSISMISMDKSISIDPTPVQTPDRAKKHGKNKS